MPSISEKELEDHIFEHHNEIEGLEGDFITRQLSMKGYGILDLLIISKEEFFDTSLIFKIVELKQGKINLNAIGQISRYRTAIERSLKKIDYPLKEVYPSKIILYLVGSGIEESTDTCYVTDLLRDVDVHVITYSLDLKNGITFENNDHDEWFSKSEKENKTLKKFIKNALINARTWQKED